MSNCLKETIIYTFLFTILFLFLFNKIEYKNKKEKYEYVSDIHSIIISIISLFSLFNLKSYDLINTKIPFFSIISGFTAGYFIADIIQINEWWINKKRSSPFIIHHLAFLIILPIIIDCNKFQLIVILFLLLELSTPFVNNRNRNKRIYGYHSTEHYNSGILMIIAFFFIRILSIPFFLKNANYLNKNIDNSLKWMIYSIYIYILLNIYWFFLMLKGIKK